MRVSNCLLVHYPLSATVGWVRAEAGSHEHNPGLPNPWATTTASQGLRSQEVEVESGVRYWTYIAQCGLWDVGWWHLYHWAKCLHLGKLSSSNLPMEQCSQTLHSSSDELRVNKENCLTMTSNTTQWDDRSLGTKWPWNLMWAVVFTYPVHHEVNCVRHHRVHWTRREVSKNYFFEHKCWHQPKAVKQRPDNLSFYD